MKQLIQQLKSGKLYILDVPPPILNMGHILVKNYYSLVSPGTESKTITDARKGYIAKARSRPKEVRQVIDLIKTNGISSTYKFVMNKLEAYSPLGYSTVGEVIAIGDNVDNFKVGDKVACGGNTAHHADVIAVPVNLAVKVPESVDLKQAAFTTIASIAIQGVRQADLKMGENCLIIGMGLVGQLTYKILETSGIFPIGIDISTYQVTMAKYNCCKNVFNREQDGIEDIILKHTKAQGTDAIIITAATSSTDPVEFAGMVARKKAKVVIVGAVSTGFSRENYYKKELELKMSSSYGPGRKDINYEEKGIDYPIGYVRWTENRNMQAFIDLLANKRLDISPLISHVFTLNEAPDAYDLILTKKEPYTGILIKYDTDKIVEQDIKIAAKETIPSLPNIGFIGAGSFAQGFLLPNIKNHGNLIGVSTAHGNNSRYVAEKYGFNYCTSDPSKLFLDKSINTIFIVTRHNLHYDFVIKGLKNNKNVFVEKPLAMNESELKNIKKEYSNAIIQGGSKHLMVGFNRRFAPAIKQIKELFPEELPKSIIMRINAGHVPIDHWINDPEIGGGRIIGEACHFIDLAMFLAGSPIISVEADSLDTSDGLYNSVVINLKMKNGSIANIGYFSNGNKNVPKEYIEVFWGGTIAKIDDFKSLYIYGNKRKMYKYKSQDKGHSTEVNAFLSSIKTGSPCPIPFEESYLSMLSTFKVLQSIKENRKIILD